MALQKEYLLVLLFLIVSFSVKSQHTDLAGLDVIIWHEDYTLQWTDFTSTSSKNEKYICEAESHIMIIGYPQTIDDKISMNLMNVFVPNNSRKTGEVSNHLLEHEQIHFNISEYYTRLIRYYLKINNFETRVEAQAFVDICLNMKDNSQKLYDLETEHGSNVKMQNKWKLEIRQKIEALDEYYKSNYTLEELGRFAKRLYY